MGSWSLLVPGVLYLNFTKLTEPMRSDLFASVSKSAPDPREFCDPNAVLT